jgi:iron complex outermembrane receptor protein
MTHPIRSWAQRALCCGISVLLAFAALPGAAQESSDEAADEEVAGEGSEDQAPPPGVEEIVVVGEVRNAPSLKDTESVVLFDAEDIQALGATDISDLSAYSPNVEIPTAGSTVPTFFIRGIGLADYNANSTGAIAVYRDGVSINSAPIQLGLLYDIDQVQILRGPQGIGPFRNASAGAINVISKRPTGEYGANLISTFGRFDERDFQGYVEAPIVDELLSGRLAFRFREREGYVTNRCGTEPPGGRPIITAASGNQASRRERIAASVCRERIDGLPPDPINNSVWGEIGGQSRLPFGLKDKLNDVGAWSARGQFLLTPDTPFAETQALLNLHGFHVDESAFAGVSYASSQDTLGGASNTPRGYLESSVDELSSQILGRVTIEVNNDPSIPPRERRREITRRTQDQLANTLARNLDPDPYTVDLNRTGFVRLDNMGGYLEITGDRGAMRLLSRTGFEWWDRSYDRDIDYTPIVLSEDVGADDAYQITQDLSLSGDFLDGDVTWNVGGLFLTEQLSADIDTFIIEQGDNVNRQYEQKTTSYGVYGDLEWSPSEDWTLEGGARWNSERKQFDFQLQNVQPSGIPRPGTAIGRSPEETWSAPTGMVALTYHFNERSSLFWKYTRGWKSGHFNGSVNRIQGSSECFCVEPENLDSFEAGTKLNFFDDRLYIEAGAFYYKYRNYQIQISAPNGSGLFSLEFRNAGGAKVLGAELMARVSPIRDLVADVVDELNFAVNFGWLDGRFTDFSDSFTVVLGDPQNPAGLTEFLIIRDYTGNRLPYSPPYTVAINAAWPIELGRIGTITPRYDGVWSDEVFFDQTEGRGFGNSQGQIFLPEYGTGQKPYWQHGLRLSYATPDANFEIAGWVRNLTNETYKINAFDLSSTLGSVLYLLSEPRTYGIDISVKW